MRARQIWRRFRRRPAGDGRARARRAVPAAGRSSVPLVAPDPAAQDFLAAAAPPSGAHPLGTDDLGRDALARIAYGARVSLQAGVLSTLLALVVGVPIGLVAGLLPRAGSTRS